MHEHPHGRGERQTPATLIKSVENGECVTNATHNDADTSILFLKSLKNALHTQHLINSKDMSWHMLYKVTADPNGGS